MTEYNATSVNGSKNEIKKNVNNIKSFTEFEKSDKKEILKVDEEINDTKKFDFSENKFALYSFLFYSFGLFIGAYFYKISSNTKIDDLITIKDNTFGVMFATKFCIYFSVFMLVAFLGFCLISYPIINIFPLMIGVFNGIKIGFYYLTYQAKGIGYSLIMIVPYTALFITVISFVINNSTSLSKDIRALTKGERELNFDLAPYIKEYLILALIITVVALIDCSLTKLLINVVTI